MTLDQFIAVAVYEARIARQWTQLDLALASGMCHDDVSTFERGLGRITWKNIKRLSEALKTTPGGLLSIAEVMYARAQRKTGSEMRRAA